MSAPKGDETKFRQRNPHIDKGRGTDGPHVWSRLLLPTGMNSPNLRSGRGLFRFRLWLIPQLLGLGEIVIRLGLLTLFRVGKAAHVVRVGKPRSEPHGLRVVGERLVVLMLFPVGVPPVSATARRVRGRCEWPGRNRRSPGRTRLSYGRQGRDRSTRRHNLDPGEWSPCNRRWPCRGRLCHGRNGPDR